jgi:hypothetical protein
MAVIRGAVLYELVELLSRLPDVRHPEARVIGPGDMKHAASRVLAFPIHDLPNRIIVLGGDTVPLSERPA